MSLLINRRFIWILLPLITLLTASMVYAQAPKTAKPGPKIKLLQPKAGDVLKPGQQIKIVWDVDLPPNIDLSWCEQEIFLSVDGGKTLSYRLSTELSPTVRSFEWTVPNLPTEQAVLDIRFGSELSTNRFERSKPQKKSAFRITRSAATLEEVKLNAPSLQPALQPAMPGDQVMINWQSNVNSLDYYEVLVSYDQGAHYNAIDRTNNESYTWTVPTGFSGRVTFKIVAHHLNGSLVESNVDTSLTLALHNQ